MKYVDYYFVHFRFHKTHTWMMFMDIYCCPKMQLKAGANKTFNDFNSRRFNVLKYAPSIRKSFIPNQWSNTYPWRKALRRLLSPITLNDSTSLFLL